MKYAPFAFEPSLETIFVERRRPRTFVARSLVCLGAALAVGCGSSGGSDGGTITASSGSGLPTDVGSGSMTMTDEGEEATSSEVDSGDGPKLDAPMETTGTGVTETSGSGDPCGDAEEQESNQGCLFWAVDLPNAWVGTPSPDNHQYAVVVANTVPDASANVDVFIGTATTPVQSAVVASGDIYTFALPSMNIPERQNSYDGTAFRIESDVPVTAYQFNPLDNTTQVFSNDASLLFPVHAWGQEYTAITGDGIQLAESALDTPDNAGSYVTVVADEDNTTISFFATAPLYPGQTDNVVLNRGQVATIVSNATVSGQAGTPGLGNLSGTRVSADKPVAVFSGSVATIEPQPGQCCADHLEHQMLPISAWGTGYTAVPPAIPGNPTGTNPAAYRITGAFDGTSLQYNPSAPPGAPAMINAQETVRFQTNQPFTVTTTDTAKPFALTQFLLSNQAIFAGPPYQNGDPAMIALPAAAQFQETYIFLAPNGYAQQYVTIIAPDTASVSLDGNDVTAGNWTPVGTLDGVNFRSIRLPVNSGSHLIEADEPVGIVSIGYDTDVSYGYPGGSGLAIIATPPPPPTG